MFENLEVFRVANQFAKHTERQHSVIARNIANADTPGYQAVTTHSFSDAFSKDAGFGPMRATRQGHIQDTEPTQGASETFVSTQTFITHIMLETLKELEGKHPAATAHNIAQYEQQFTQLLAVDQAIYEILNHNDERTEKPVCHVDMRLFTVHYSSNVNI